MAAREMAAFRAVACMGEGYLNARVSYSDWTDVASIPTLPASRGSGADRCPSRHRWHSSRPGAVASGGARVHLEHRAGRAHQLAGWIAARPDAGRLSAAGGDGPGVRTGEDADR